MNIIKVKKERIAAVVGGIFCCLLGSYVTGFGAFIVYLAIRSGIKGDVIEDVIIALLLGLGIMLLSLLVWRLVVRYFKEAKQLRQYITENEDKPDASESTASDRGQLMSEGVMTLAVGVFGIIWMMGLWEAGAPWFAAMGAFLVIAAGATAVYNLKAAMQIESKMHDVSEVNEQQDSDAKGKRGRILGILLLGALSVYTIITDTMAFSRGISEKELPMFVLFNVLLILAIIVQIRNGLKKAKSSK